jgi:hypothetical protein
MAVGARLWDCSQQCQRHIAALNESVCVRTAVCRSVLAAESQRSVLLRHGHSHAGSLAVRGDTNEQCAYVPPLADGTPRPHLWFTLSLTLTHSPPHSHLFNSITGTLSQHRKAIIWRHLRRPPAPTVSSQVNTSVPTLSTNPSTTPSEEHTCTHTPTHSNTLPVLAPLESTSFLVLLCANQRGWKVRPPTVAPCSPRPDCSSHRK